MSLILKLSQCKISRSGSLQQLAPESGAIVSCRRSCPGHAADEDEEEEVDEEEEEDEEEEKEAMEKELPSRCITNAHRAGRSLSGAQG